MSTTSPNSAVPLTGRTTQQDTDPETALAAGVHGYTTFADLGCALRSARKARNLSLEDVAGTLKLSVSVLQALEDGNRDKFPHSAYAKGFLRSYAGFLKFDPESYREVLKIFTPEPELTEPVYAPDRSARPRIRTPWLGAVVSLLIACLIGWSVWHFQLLDLLIKEGNPDPQTTAPMQSSASASLEQSLGAGQDRDAVSANPNQSAGAFSGISGQVTQEPVLSGNMQTPAQATPGMPAGAGSVSSEGSPSKSLSLVEPGEREPLPAVVLPGSPWATLQGNATLAGEAGLAEPEPAAVGNPNNPNLPIPPEAQMAADGKKTVTVVAEAVCWTQVTADSGRAVQRTLQVGETFTVTFEKSLSLRLGNAGGVRVFYNGTELDKGRAGQVRNLTFPPRPER